MTLHAHDSDLQVLFFVLLLTGETEQEPKHAQQQSQNLSLLPSQSTEQADLINAK